MEACEFDPHELERCEERLFALRAMSRKYATPIETPAGAGAEICRRSGGSRGQPQRGRRASRSGSADARAAYAAAAGALSAAREERRARAREGGHRRTAAAQARARGVQRRPYSATTALVSATGYDRAEFLVRTNPGSRLGPLMKVASGGELSRFLLAIKVCLAERGTAPDPRLRRNRHRRRRRGRRRNGTAARAARRARRRFWP